MAYKLTDLFGLNGKRALVTGASKGIGLEIARAISDLGAEVIGIGRSISESLDGSRFQYIQCDINDYENLNLICQTITKNKIHNLDILVNCAGSAGHDLAGSNLEKFNSLVGSNLVGTYGCCDVAVQYMGNKTSSSIINITSIASLQAFPNNPGYIASKGGIRMLTKSLALDYGPKNIRVNSIAPGYIHTDMTKESYQDEVRNKERASRTIMNRWGDVSEIVGATIFLASKSSEYITGTDLIIDGGWTSKGL